MIKLRRIKQNLKNWNRTRQKDIDALTNLESEYNDKLLAADINPKDVLLYDELLRQVML